LIPANIIANKRDGFELTTEEISFMVEGFSQGEVADYQMSAFAMAVLLRKMSRREVLDLTNCMVNSGTRLPRGSKPRVDKHSSGGIGDKTSLIIAPLLACAGYHVPMISGRGLGITGGTLDKLEAIPGFRTNLSDDEISAQLEQVGCVITGATDSIAPADRKLYALRDVTGTVPSMALIIASIMSKKIAENLDALVLDVKVGSGSFQSDLTQGQLLLTELLRVGNSSGIATSGLISDMTQPLGCMIGNAVEVIESIEVLRGAGPQSVRDLSIELATRALHAMNRNSSRESLRTMLESFLSDGSAYEKFEQMVRGQGGTLPQEFPLETKRLLNSPRTGVLTEIDGAKIGYAVIAMGGGRKKAGDTINHRVGIKWLTPLGTVLGKGDPLAEVYCDSEADFMEAFHLILGALRFQSKSTGSFVPLWQ
jgi:pyrimidine-nucleoside phosphorylase